MRGYASTFNRFACSRNQNGSQSRAAAANVGPPRMPHDPNHHFDHAVLDMIEHSPVGAVPVTPAYQDALKRLYSAHQVYESADHKGGHVTARSLTGVPTFHAGNIEGVADGSVPESALESNASIFDRYLASLPAALRAGAEAHRLKVAGRPVHHRAKHAGSEKLPPPHDMVHTIFLVPGCGPHPGLPGNYLFGSVVQHDEGSHPGSWTVHLHDREDGAALFEAGSLKGAVDKLLETAACAPFTMDELGDLGYRAV